MVITIFSGLSLQVQEAFAIAATVSSRTTGDTAGDSTATTTIDVVFSQKIFVDDEAGDGVAVDKQALFSIDGAGAGVGITSANIIDVQALNPDDTACNTAGASATVAIILDVAIATDALPTVTFTNGAGDVKTCDGAETAVTASAATAATDGLSPAFASTATTSVTTIDVVFTETIDDAGTVAIGDFTLGGTIASGAALTGTPAVAGSTVTLSLDKNIAVGDTPTIAYTETDGDLEDAGNNFVRTFSAKSVTNNVGAVTGNDGSSGCRGDCSAPTLGIDEQFTRVVENGFTYNGNTINVERYFTPYPLITVEVGKQNKAVFKIYENSGPDNIQHFELAFGLDIGQVMGTSNAMISWDKSHDGTETVTVVDPNNALENVRVSTSEGKCKADSTTNDCLIITVSHTFRESLDFDIVGTNVWDYRQHSWQNFYNHGIHIEGESLNPPDEYVGYCHNILCSSIKGNLVHLIETGKNTAVDEQGYTWTFDNTWIQDYVSKGKIDDQITSQGYDRDHVKFNAIMQEQELAATSLFEKYYKTSVSDEPNFAEIDDIKFYEYPDTIDKKFDPVLLAKMHQEDIRAQKYLEELFAKMYPGKVFD